MNDLDIPSIRINKEINDWKPSRALQIPFMSNAQGMLRFNVCVRLAKCS